MTHTVADGVGSRTERATALAAGRDPAAAEYTVYPAWVDAADIVTTWLTVDETVVCELDDWR